VIGVAFSASGLEKDVSPNQMAEGEAKNTGAAEKWLIRYAW